MSCLSDNGGSGGGQENGSANHSISYNGLAEGMEEVAGYYEEFGQSTCGNGYPAGWAQVSNTPFSKYKNSAFAAGINTPLIVYNP